MNTNWLSALAALSFAVAMPAAAQRAASTPVRTPLDLPMGRDGSGTSWLPDDSPVYAWHATAGSWLFMFHDNAFIQYMGDGSARGSKQFGSTNWAMAMARHGLAGGSLTFRTMLSAEPGTVGRCGYPDLLATGERCNGLPLHDRQHPHDAFMELAVDYQRAITRGLALAFYGGPAGEPALGPVAFPHRVSAMVTPLAPITHHWLDATHIAFGVATVGVYGRRWKIEGSVFNGREPDERRYNIDLGRLDSYSGRLWFLPTPRWALQASVGRLKEVETDPVTLEVLTLTRATASVAYQRTAESKRAWAAFLAWGANIEDGNATHGLIGETSLMLRERSAVFARAEVNGKTGHDLALSAAANSPLQRETFVLGKVSAGYTHSLRLIPGLRLGIGASVSLSVMPERLRPYYGTTTAGGFALTLNLRPPRLNASARGGHDMMNMPETAS